MPVSVSVIDCACVLTFHDKRMTSFAHMKQRSIHLMSAIGASLSHAYAAVQNLALQAQGTVSYQAALGSDGTSNNSINSLLNRTTLVMSSVVVLVFVIRSGILYAQGKKAKEILSESSGFAVVLALIVGVFIIVKIITSIVNGVG